MAALRGSAASSVLRSGVPPLSEQSHASRNSLSALTLGAIGIVYGDIGTSPLYAFREALAQTAQDGIVAAEVLGVLSLALWALIFVVTMKYVLFLTHMDNNGEGGVLSLMALARRATGGGWLIVLLLGATGASLFYGDAIITPALSVLSAVEGLKTIPGLEGMTEPSILGITVGILAGLFALQVRGTAGVAGLFGPICMVWFMTLAGLGIWHIADAPQILGAFNPLHAVQFMTSHGVTGLFVLGAVFLTVTGAEALIADMGHFGRKPIQLFGPNNGALAGASVTSGKNIASFTTVDATYRLRLKSRTTLAVSALNILDQDPPFARLDQNYDPFTASPLGFTLKVAVSQDF